jgi:exodeoxyribonuclease-3
MKIISWNVNGLRSIIKKGDFYSLVESESPDIICIQESRCLPEQITLEPSFLEKYPFRIWNNPLIKKGYSGTIIFSKIEFRKSFKGIGIHKHDQEGRVLTIELDDFFLVNVYVPNSKTDLSRLSYRINEWDSAFKEYLFNLESLKPIVVTGDFNTIHSSILDIHNPKIKNVAGATEEEKKSFDKYLEHFVDSFRYLNKKTKKYTWWSNFGKCRQNNIGWRIDYFLVSKQLIEKVAKSDILDTILGSDHAPCILII